MNLIKKRINELQFLALQAEINGDIEQAIKYQFAANELTDINHKILTEAIEKSIANLAIDTNNIVTKP